MQKISRLDWPAGVWLDCYGVVVGIRTNRESAIPRILEALPPGCRVTDPKPIDYLYSVKVAGASRPGVRQFNLLYSDVIRRIRTENVQDIYHTLRDDMEDVFSALAKRHTFIHAGVVAWKGRAILIPGRSLTGKTTLTRALLRAGASYMSDEFAILDRRGLVHPYPRAMFVRREGQELPDRVPVETLGARIQKRPLRAGAVVIAPYREGARWRPRVMTRGEAALELLANAVPVRSKPQEVLRTLEKLTENVVTLRSPRGEADEVAADLCKRLS